MKVRGNLVPYGVGELVPARAHPFDDLARVLGCRSDEGLLRGVNASRLEGVASELGLDRIRLLRFDTNADLEDIIAELEASALVEYAEPNYYVTPGSQDDNSTPTPNDPGFSEQWGLRNLGLSVGGFPAFLNADIKALEAWQMTTGSPDVLIAISDTGVDITHPDLAPNIYTNLAETPDNGRDDDGNGFVDDVHGYNVADNNSDVSDVLGHGTQMAGIIAGMTNNEIGISGLSQSRIIPVRFFRRTGPDPDDVAGTVADAARSLVYSITAGAHIINASWSTPFGRTGEEAARALEDAVTAANRAGVLLVSIAGNQGANIDFTPVYPASYSLPNQIVAAASDFTDSLWHQYGAPSNVKTNFGPRTVHLAAPGVLVYTTAAKGDCDLCTTSDDPDDWYAFADGSSAAAAFVSGAAALVKSRFPDQNVILLRRRLVESVDQRDSLRGYLMTSGRLNAASALTILLSTSQPVLTKVKYKAGSEKVVIIGGGIDTGAYVVVKGKSYPTKKKGEQWVASVPQSQLPIGEPVSIRILNLDGGTSLPFVLTR